MDLRLRGKVALVTGSSRGIGLATASAFAAEGCRVMLSARSTEQLRETEEALRATGAEVAAHAADVGSPDGAAGLIEATVAAHGGIDILVNNVGGGGGGAHIADSSDDDWRGALERNLIQTVRMMRLALPHMKERPGPAVISVASISGWSPQFAMSGQYGAAKAALIYDTERPPRFPDGPPRNCREVADVIVFIASLRAHWINGRNIPVNVWSSRTRPPDRRPY